MAESTGSDVLDSNRLEESTAPALAVVSPEFVANSGPTMHSASGCRALVESFTDRWVVAQYFEHIAASSGQVVTVIPDYACLPVMMDRDRLPVPLYYLVDVLDDLIDYKEVQREIPSLSIGQVAAGIKFLRRLSQFNVRDVDLEEMEQEILMGLGHLPGQLSMDLTNQETTRVLSAGPE